MPQIADISVKKNDGTTNVTYTAVVPSAGDRSPAIWRSQSVGSAAGHQPSFQMTSRYNGARTARRVELTGGYPSLVTGTDGVTRVVNSVLFTAQVVLPVDMPTTDINEAVSQLSNLLASPLVVAANKSGFAPT